MKLVVIIDDDVHAMSYYKEYLEQEDYKVELIGNSVDAIGFIENNIDSIAAIVLDNIMPTSDKKVSAFFNVEKPRDVGIAVLEKINQIKKKAKKDIPVIMRSIVNDDDVRNTAIAMGVVAYLWKLDTDAAALAEEIRKHVKGTS
jgi:CheY-like chemotaxis protein